MANTAISTTAVANITGATISSASSATAHCDRPENPRESAQASRLDSQPPPNSQPCSQPVSGAHSQYAVAAQKTIASTKGTRSSASIFG